MVSPFPKAVTVEHDPPESAPLEPLALSDFLALDIPPRENLLAPIIMQKSVNMLFGPRGCGKTHLGVGIAVAVATGTAFLHWQAPEPRRVVYIDGEMPATALQERFDAATRGIDNFSYAATHLAILASDLRLDGLPNLATLEGQARYAPKLEGFELIIVDNIATLCRGGKENESDSWALLQAWALEQRRAGRAVLFLHHSGKGGDQRGTSAREDIMDTVIKLSRPTDYKPAEGARMIVEFSKARGIMGQDAEPFEARLAAGVWTVRAATSARDESILELKDIGLTQRQIAIELSISAATVNRVLQRHGNAASVAADNDDELA